MANVLRSDEATLHWACWDPTGTLAALLQDRLRKWQVASGCDVRYEAIEGLEALNQSVKRGDWNIHTGPTLIAWHMEGSEEFEAILNSLLAVRKRLPKSIQVVRIAPEWNAYAHFFIEAGAQVVISQLPSLERILPRILDSVPLSSVGSHPILSGIAKRLPWNDEA